MTFQTNTNLIIVVEGIGHVVQNYYAPALRIQKKNYKNKLSIIFVDESKYWRKSGDTEKIEKYENFKANLKSWARYIDKSTDKGAKAYAKLKAKVVFIATPDDTHVKLALNWLIDEEKCESIFIEKPLDSSLSKTRVLQFYSIDKSSKIFPLDHYLARFIPLRNTFTMKGIIQSIGGSIEQITFYLLEDRSYPYTGPIEKDKRTDAVRKGLVLDMFPHILALIHHLGRIETIEITDLKVARYTYEDENGVTIPASISKETFANIGFTLKNYSNKIIQANVYIGKGIAGSKNLKIKGDLKRLELLGKNGKKCIIDLRNTDCGGTGKVEITDKKGNYSQDECRLLDEPYTVLIQQVVDKHLRDPSLDLKFHLPIKTAKDSLTCMHEILSLIENFEKTNTEIPPYHIKTVIEDENPISKAPYLEDVMAKLKDKDVKDVIGIDKLITRYEDEN